MAAVTTQERLDALFNEAYAIWATLVTERGGFDSAVWSMSQAAEALRNARDTVATGLPPMDCSEQKGVIHITVPGQPFFSCGNVDFTERVTPMQRVPDCPECIRRWKEGQP